jgi:hypothetical protein
MSDPADQCYRRRQPKTMNDEVRGEIIAKLRAQGWTWKRIGQRVGLSDTGAKRAHVRARAGVIKSVDEVKALEQW